MQADQRVDDDGAELLAGAARDLPHRPLDRASAAIGAVVGDRVEAVGDRDDARGLRDLVAGEAARVARSVPPLVMGARDRRG